MLLLRPRPWKYREEQGKQGFALTEQRPSPSPVGKTDIRQLKTLLLNNHWDMYNEGKKY